MARIRSIKPAFYTSEDICRLQPLARLLFQGLWCEADREGRLEDKPGQLKIRILPTDDCDVDALLWDLARAAVIRRYRAADGHDYIHVIEFLKHQRPHPKEPKSVIPADGEDRKPCNYTASREKVSVHPADYPSSPVGMDKEYGVQEGSGSDGARARSVPTLIRKRNLNAAYEGPIFDIPNAWAQKALRESNGRFKDSDIDAFGAWLTRECERECRGVEGRLLAWLDAEWVRWQAVAEDDRRAEAMKARSRQWEADMDAAIAEANRGR